MDKLTTESVISTPPTVEDALTVAQWNLPVHPLYPRSKQPALEVFKDEATTEPARIRHLWRTRPDANVGTVVDSTRVVIDVDPRHNGLVGWRTLCAQHGALPPTWQWMSGRSDGGFGLSFRLPAGAAVPSVTKLAGLGVEALGPGHNVVLPPSLHVDTGQPYVWLDGHAPWEISEADAPFWLLDAIAAATPAPPKRAKGPRAYKASDLAAQGSKQGTHGGGPGTLFTASAAQHSEHLVRLFCDPENLPKLLAACGLDPTLHVGAALCCPMHDDQTPSATLLGPNDQYVSFGIKCHASACNKYYALTDIYKARVSANILDIHPDTGPSRAPLRLLWLTRFLHAAGVLTLRQDWGAPSVPSHASPDVRAVVQAFLEVRLLRSATRELDAPLPFTLRFIQDWLGRAYTIGFNHAKVAKRLMIHAGIIVAAEQEASGEWLWRLGGMMLRKARQAIAPLSSRVREEAIIAAVSTTDPLPPPAPSSVCPDVAQDGHAADTCPLCRAQARLLELRARNGPLRLDEDPFGRACGSADLREGVA